MFSIEIQGLSKTYKNGHQALKEINLKVKKVEGKYMLHMF